MYDRKIDRKKVEDFEKRNQYFDKVRLNEFLTELGISKSPRQAFYGYTKDIEDKTRYVVSSQEFFEMAKTSGGVSILAHPMKYLKYYDNIDEIEELILSLKAEGLDGIEGYNNRQTLEDEKELTSFAKANNLLISAGSDFHSKIGEREEKHLGEVLGHEICSEDIQELLFLSKAR